MSQWIAPTIILIIHINHSFCHEGPCKMMLLWICSPTHYLHLGEIREQCNKVFQNFTVLFQNNNNYVTFSFPPTTYLEVLVRQRQFSRASWRRPVTQCPCWRAWLSSCCPVWPVAPRTAILMTYLDRTSTFLAKAREWVNYSCQHSQHSLVQHPHPRERAKHMNRVSYMNRFNGKVRFVSAIFLLVI